MFSQEFYATMYPSMIKMWCQTHKIKTFDQFVANQQESIQFNQMPGFAYTPEMVEAMRKYWDQTFPWQANRWAMPIGQCLYHKKTKTEVCVILITDKAFYTGAYLFSSEKKVKVSDIFSVGESYFQGMHYQRHESRDEWTIDHTMLLNVVPPLPSDVDAVKQRFAESLATEVIWTVRSES